MCDRQSDSAHVKCLVQSLLQIIKAIWKHHSLPLAQTRLTQEMCALKTSFMGQKAKQMGSALLFSMKQTHLVLWVWSFA